MATYKELVIMFQDRYGEALKKAGIPEYTLDTETILDYIYSAEIELLHTLAKNKDLDGIKNHVGVVPVPANTLSAGPVANSKITQDMLFDYYITSRSVVDTTHLSEQDDGAIGNEIIRPEEAYLFYKSHFNSPYFKNPKVYIEDNDLDGEGNARIFDYTFNPTFE